MADDMTLTVTTNTIPPFILTTAETSTFVLSNSGNAVVTIQMGPTLGGLVNLTGPAGSPSPRFVSCFVPGVPLDGEVLFATDAPYDFSITPVNCEATALVAATSDTTFDIKVETNLIGTITFEAGQTTGTFNFIGSTDVEKSNLITITTPPTSDNTLADITFLLA